MFKHDNVTTNDLVRLVIMYTTTTTS